MLRSPAMDIYEFPEFTLLTAVEVKFPRQEKPDIFPFGISPVLSSFPITQDRKSICKQQEAEK